MNFLFVKGNTNIVGHVMQTFYTDKFAKFEFYGKLRKIITVFRFYAN